MRAVIDGAIESAEQLKNTLLALGQTTYVANPQPVFTSTAGQHTRHILDLYRALINHQTRGVIDYDVRRRNHPVECHKHLGLEAVEELLGWLKNLDEARLGDRVQIKSEVMLSTQRACVLTSTLGRELCFVASHGIHHLAIIAAIARFFGDELESAIGLAPATASYQRTQV
ncbi:MAG TPA: hypothetical protein DCZ12_08410 [Gammaproteobacteria bacterium]|nr:hypothetical protein [Gammaproteobacteria bacterium]